MVGPQRRALRDRRHRARVAAQAARPVRARQEAARRRKLLAASLLTALLSCLLLLLPIDSPAGGQPMSSPSAPVSAGQGFQLPTDPQAEILRWHASGGMGLASAEPALLLRAGGDFEARPVPDASGQFGQRRRGHLAPAALQSLLAEVLVQHRLASLSGPAMQAQIEAIGQRTGRLFRVMDGGETAIAVNLPGLRHEVRLPALHAAQRLFPELADVQHLHAIQQRLLQLADTAR